MDNLTHTLIGALIGTAAAEGSTPQSGGLSKKERHTLLVTMMVAGSNLPDLDFLYSAVTGSKLDYLLHHRGHTHTVLGALMIAALLLFATEWWLRRRRRTLVRADHGWLIGIALLAPLLHIAMDMANNYGVHPWWPFDNRWLYGDSVFIIEPLLWTASAPLVFLLRTKIARSLVAVVLVAGIALTFFIGLVPTWLAVIYTLLTASMLFAAYGFAPRTALACGISFWIAVTLGFIVTSQFAGRRIEALAASNFSDAQLLDSILTPMPVNPLCWEVMLVQRQDEAVVIRRAMLALLPAVLSAQRCPGRSLNVPITAPLEPIAAADTDTVAWHGEVRSDVIQLASLWAANCHVKTFMRFARAPWLAPIDGELTIGDLRYDREAALGFAEYSLESETDSCLARVPPWTPPRSDLAPLRRVGS